MRNCQSPTTTFLAKSPSDAVVIQNTHSPQRLKSAKNRKGKTQIGIKQKIKEITSSDNNIKAVGIYLDSKHGSAQMQFRHTTNRLHVSNTPSISKDGLFLPQSLKPSLVNSKLSKISSRPQKERYGRKQLVEINSTHEAIQSLNNR